MTPPSATPRFPRARAWFGRSICARIVTLSLLLLLAIQLLSVGAVRANLSASIRSAVPDQLRITLGLIALIGLVVFLVGSLFIARSVSAPLHELAEAADRIGAGDTGTPMRALGRRDEIGHLAQAFEKMRVSVDEKRNQILQLAYWDSLTGLPNRVQFRDAVREAIARASPHLRSDGDVGSASPTVAVIMLDLDRFKHVNDVLGYRVGDLLLGRVGERLTQ
jgi:HAMP domain-containing protein